MVWYAHLCPSPGTCQWFQVVLSSIQYLNVPRSLLCQRSFSSNLNSPTLTNSPPPESFARSLPGSLQVLFFSSLYLLSLPRFSLHPTKSKARTGRCLRDILEVSFTGERYSTLKICFPSSVPNPMNGVGHLVRELGHRSWRWTLMIGIIAFMKGACSSFVSVARIKHPWPKVT